MTVVIDGMKVTGAVALKVVSVLMITKLRLL